MNAKYGWYIATTIVWMALLFAGQFALAGILVALTTVVALVVSMVTGKQSNDGCK